MKTGAVPERAKGRDFYDFIFLSGITDPDFGYLSEKFEITSDYMKGFSNPVKKLTLKKNHAILRSWFLI
jgi:hypothetical protein